jgi:type II secretory pathway predicted ATPase ExeA
MNRKTLDHWQLSAPPFENNRDRRFFFESTDHREALTRLDYIVQDGNMMMGMLSGEVGCGKTLTGLMLASRVRLRDGAVAYLDFADFDLRGILSEIVRQITDGAADLRFDSTHAATAALKEALERLRRARSLPLVVVVDEAQLLHPDVLDRLRALTNLGSETENSMTLILVGQPDLVRTVKQLPQLDQRVSVRFHLNPLSFDDTQRYIRHRLTVAGHPDGALFTAAAVEQIYQLTRGVPRQINRLARLCLDFGCAQGCDLVESELVSQIARDQGWD